MSELAYNKDGERFEPHDAAAFWRARRCRERGLEVVYKRGGCTPLTLPINASEAEFAHEVAYAAGKYRLDQLDEGMLPISDAPPAYVYVHPSDNDAPSTVDDATSPTTTRAPAPWRSGAPLSPMEQLLAQVVDANTKMATAVIERFGGYMDSSAHLVRAADGAGMPARAPLELRNAEVQVAAPHVDEDDEDDGHATWPDIIQSCLPYVDAAFAAVMAPKLRNNKRSRSEQTKRAPANDERPVEDASAVADDSQSVAEASTPEITPAMRAHFMSIYARLTPEEAGIAREVAGEMTESELAAWMVDLSSISIDEATQKVKAKLAELMPKSPAAEVVS